MAQLHRIPFNPSLEECPDFSLPQHDLLRGAYIAFIALPDVTNNEEAIAYCAEHWKVVNLQRTALYRQQQQVDAAAAKFEKKKQPKQAVIDYNLSVPDSMPLRPPAFATKRLRSFEWCPLEPFTIEGCADTVNSKKVIADRDLTWSQFMYVSTPFIAQLRIARWEQENIDDHVQFFRAVQNHYLCQTETGRQALLLYVDKIRWAWHVECENGTAFSMAKINEIFLSECTLTVTANATAKRLDELRAIAARAELSHSSNRYRRNGSPPLSRGRTRHPKSKSPPPRGANAKTRASRRRSRE